jgi:hypothetical protein
MWPVVCVSREGDIRWIFAATARYNRSNFVVRSGHLYSLDASKTDERGKPRVSLVRRNLENGGVLKWAPVASWTGALGNPTLWTIAVTEDEKWVTCAKMRGYCTCLISAETAQLARRIGDLQITQQVSFVPGVPHSCLWERELWSTPVALWGGLFTTWVCYRSTYDPEGGYFYREKFHFSHQWNDCVLASLDPERKLAFCPSQKTRSAELSVLPLLQWQEMQEVRNKICSAPMMVIQITIPTKKTPCDRQAMPGSKRMRKPATFGYDGNINMVKDFLVCQNAGGNILTVSDFWPTW